jgi:hypothetical protein
MTDPDQPNVVTHWLAPQAHAGGRTDR